MSKSGAEQEKDEEEMPENLPSDVKLTRNRRQLLQRQQKSSEEGGPDDPEADNSGHGKRTTTPEGKPAEENDPEKERPSSDPEKKPAAAEAAEPEPPSQLQIDSSSSSSSSLKQKLAKAKAAAMPQKEGENTEQDTEEVPMKTRSGRSSLPVIKKQIKPAANNGTGKNILTKRRRGKPALNTNNNNNNANNCRANRKSKKLYDEAGALLSNGKDYCDCLETDCPGCHFPCKKCGSEKCGTECRCERAWIYDEVKIEGLGITLKNSAC